MDAGTSAGGNTTTLLSVAKTIGEKTVRLPAAKSRTPSKRASTPTVTTNGASAIVTTLVALVRDVLDATTRHRPATMGNATLATINKQAGARHHQFEAPRH